jgi:hypothetical protein
MKDKLLDDLLLQVQMTRQDMASEIDQLTKLQLQNEAN